jgi:hypothetical protein
VNRFVFVADRAYNLVGIKEDHSVIGAAATTVRPRKIQADGIAPNAAAGANVVELSAAIALDSTVNTVQKPTVTVSAISAGDRIALNYSAPPTGLVGVLQLELQPA